MDEKEDGGGSSSPSSSSDGKLYSIKIRLEPPPGSNVNCKGNDQELRLPFWGGELVGLRSSRWKPSEEVPLGVVQSWDPRYDKKSKRIFRSDALAMRVLVCVSSGGGDGVGGRGGWLPLSNIQECLGKAKPGEGVPVSLVGTGSLITSSREFQAVMSVKDFPERLRRCLLDPAMTKERGLPTASPWRKLAVGKAIAVGSDNTSVEADTAVSAGTDLGTDAAMDVAGGDFDGESGSGSAGAGGGGAAAGGVWGEAGPPPRYVPGKLWEAVVNAYNPSQVQAIRKVAVGSPSGFTLLQVRVFLGGAGERWG